MFYYYTYKVVLPETGEYYFGSRKSKVPAKDDVKYKGSMCTWKPDVNKLIKEIIDENFITHKDALIKEDELIRKHISDPLNKNYAFPNGELYTHSPKEWILKKYGYEKGYEILKEIYNNNSGIWRKGHKPWNTGKHLSEQHLENIRKTWHSDTRMKVMQSEEYKNKMSKSLSGEKNPMFNKTIYEIWNIKYGKDIADKKLAKWKANKHGQKAWNKDIPITEDARLKLKESLKDRAWIFNEMLKKNKRVKKTELEKFINDGWKQGYKKF